MPGWSGVQLGPRLREDLGLPVAVVGDVQAHALGEAHWGVGKGKFSVLCLGIGTGIGGAYVESGRVMQGFHGAAGHMGHIECSAAARHSLRLRAFRPSGVGCFGHFHWSNVR